MGKSSVGLGKRLKKALPTEAESRHGAHIVGSEEIFPTGVATHPVAESRRGAQPLRKKLKICSYICLEKYISFMVLRPFSFYSRSGWRQLLARPPFQLQTRR